MTYVVRNTANPWMKRGWWVAAYEDGGHYCPASEEGKTQHYIPNGGSDTMCGLRLSGVVKRAKLKKCKTCIYALERAVAND